jgi:hypothetical protein
MIRVQKPASNRRRCKAVNIGGKGGAAAEWMSGATVSGDRKHDEMDAKAVRRDIEGFFTRILRKQ